MLKTMTVNRLGTVRNEEFQGRKYLVAPMTLIVPGVLNGSKGALYYPEEEVTKNPGAWNHTPITLDHPQNLPAGQWSARTTKNLETTQLGFIFNAKAQDGKLVAEGWFDIEQTKRVDNSILDSIRDGNRVELSTGLQTDDTKAEAGASFDGVAYEGIARNYRPDHLAILVTARGACSINDGCGVLNKEDEPKTNQSYWNKFKDILGLTGNEIPHENLHSQLSLLLQERFIGGSVYILTVYNKRVIYQNGTRLYEIDYSRSKNKVTLGTLPVEVVMKSKYVTVNTEEGVEDMSTKEITTVSSIVANCDCLSAEDKTALNGLSDKGLAAFNKQIADSVKPAEDAKDGEDDEEKMDENGKPKKGKKPTFKKGEKPDFGKKENEAAQTDEEWLASAPAGIRASVENSMRIEATAKQQLISVLTANTDEADLKIVKNALAAKSISELETLALMIPKTNQQGQGQSQGYNRFGPGGTTEEVVENSEEECLALPSMMDFANNSNEK